MKYLLLTSAAALTLAGAAFAQDANTSKPGAAAQPSAATQSAPAQSSATQPSASASVGATAVTDAEVQQVAALAADVRKLNEAAKPKLAAAADATAKEAVQKDLDDSIQASLTKHGLTVDRYNEIASAAASDKALAARISAANTGDATAASATVRGSTSSE